MRHGTGELKDVEDSNQHHVISYKHRVFGEKGKRDVGEEGASLPLEERKRR